MVNRLFPEEFGARRGASPREAPTTPVAPTRGRLCLLYRQAQDPRRETRQKAAASRVTTHDAHDAHDARAQESKILFIPSPTANAPRSQALFPLFLLPLFPPRARRRMRPAWLRAALVAWPSPLHLACCVGLGLPSLCRLYAGLCSFSPRHPRHRSMPRSSWPNRHAHTLTLTHIRPSPPPSPPPKKQTRPHTHTHTHTPLPPPPRKDTGTMRVTRSALTSALLRGDERVGSAAWAPHEVRARVRFLGGGGGRGG